MRGAKWLVMPVTVATFVAGCTGDEPRSQTEPRHSERPTEAPTPTSGESISRAKLAQLAAFLDKAEPVEKGRVGAEFSLMDVRYTSPTDAAAEFWDCGKKFKFHCTTIIATTDDNWAHAAGLAIPDTLADLVSYITVGRGAVAIKATNQLSTPRRSYPPFVLYPDGNVKPLHIADQPHPFDAGNNILVDNYGDFYYEVGMGKGMWAADVDAAGTFRLPDSPGGILWDYVPGRGGALLSVSGYHKNVGDGVWRFAESTDNARTWRTTDVRLPLGGKPIWQYAGDYREAVGPGHLQAVAMLDAPPDLPMYLWELWLTDDEKAFRRVPLPWERMAFGGMVFASDGALLLAEAKGPPALCAADICGPGRIWRLPPGKAEMKPLADAPRVSSRLGLGLGLRNSGGGMIVAHTGGRTIALSTDGYDWTKVTPGL